MSSSKYNFCACPSVIVTYIFNRLGYLSQYFTSLINNNGITCAWYDFALRLSFELTNLRVLNNVYNRAGWDGVTPWSITLLQDIDQASDPGQY
jgi:hypothetical protein